MDENKRKEIILKLQIIKSMPNGSPRDWQKAYEWLVGNDVSIESANLTEEIKTIFAKDDARSIVNNRLLCEIEKEAILNAYELCNHNKRETAQVLGISERHIYRKLKEYGL